ncbi:hypothetical protein R1flu_025779 [Riccia fluitans]|uniref:DNA-directed RNA polymerase n=1 Tax=Riccia fluitans TaxID=41844 RepID=A0ABD1XYQ8_9MARC
MEVVHDELRGDLLVNTDSGRVLRPLLVVRKNKLNINLPSVATQISEKKGEPRERFAWFLQNDVIELLGIEEAEKALIALHGADLVRAGQLKTKNGVFLCRDQRSVTDGHGIFFVDVQPILQNCSPALCSPELVSSNQREPKPETASGETRHSCIDG